MMKKTNPKSATTTIHASSPEAPDSTRSHPIHRGGTTPRSGAKEIRAPRARMATLIAENPACINANCVIPRARPTSVIVPSPAAMLPAAVREVLAMIRLPMPTASATSDTAAPTKKPEESRGSSRCRWRNSR
jgi:hypothetical protein